MNPNIDTVMQIYAAFGRGDVPFILDQFSDDIRWDHGIRETELAYLQPGTGKQHAVAFFTALAENIEFTKFEPAPPCASGDTVMVAVTEAARNLVTGAVLPEEISVHIWTFGSDGKAQAFRHVLDIASHEAAARVAAPAGTS